MIRYLLPLMMVAGCGPIPVQVSKQDQTQRVAQDVAQAADQQSSHASESKQGTNSMPVIIICNTVSSPNGHCIAPNEDGPVQKAINSNFKGVSR